VKIALVSDTHLAARAVEFAANWRHVGAWIRSQEFDLVIHLGDITADGASNPAELAEALALLSVAQTEIRYVPGNHDIGDNPPGPGVTLDEHAFDPIRLQEYRKIFGADRWSLDVESWHLLGLNAQLFGTGTAEEEDQFGWLRSDLEGRSGHVGLFLHKPLFRDSADDAEVHVRYVPAAPRRRLLQLLAGKNLRFVISGHAHQGRQFVSDGVDHIWLPSTAFTIPAVLQEKIGEKHVGAAVLQVSGGHYQIELIQLEGLKNFNLLDHPHVYPQIAQLRKRLAEATAS
jgi:3',5'-cyclic AMP phosphodiesterase CpdA